MLLIKTFLHVFRFSGSQQWHTWTKTFSQSHQRLILVDLKTKHLSHPTASFHLEGEQEYVQGMSFPGLKLLLQFITLWHGLVGSYVQTISSVGIQCQYQLKGYLFRFGQGNFLNGHFNNCWSSNQYNVPKISQFYDQLTTILAYFVFKL